MPECEINDNQPIVSDLSKPIELKAHVTKGNPKDYIISWKCMQLESDIALGFEWETKCDLHMQHN